MGDREAAIPEAAYQQSQQIRRSIQGLRNENQDRNHRGGESRKRKRPKEHYLAQCLLKLARSGGGGGGNAASTSASPAAAAAVSSAPKIQGREGTRLFECEFCGKTFGKSEALGSHKGSHRNKDPPSFSSTASAAAAAKKPKISVLKPDGKPHVCEICFKSFPNGQALGGHKRSHADAPTSAGDRSPAAFDLNLIPAADETYSSGSDVTVSGFGGASSHDHGSAGIELGLRLGRSVDQWVKSQTTVSDGDGASRRDHQLEEIDLELRLGTSVDQKAKRQTTDENEPSGRQSNRELSLWLA